MHIFKFNNTNSQILFKCKQCGKDFIVHHGRQQYCSLSCAWRFRQEVSRQKKLKSLTCPMCGEEFRQIHGLQRFCSDTCRIRQFNNNKIYIKICPICSIEFKTVNPLHKFCSKTCKNKNENRHKTKRSPKLVEKLGHCEVCGLSIKEALEAHHYTHKDLIVLCGSCHNIWHRLSSEKHSAKEIVISMVSNHLLNSQISLTKGTLSPENPSRVVSTSIL